MDSNTAMLAGVAPEVFRAATFALEAHDSVRQTDKSGAPYFDHSRRVALKLLDEEGMMVALLHDVLEDTPVTETELRALFPEQIVDAVVVLTKSDADSEPYDEYYRRVRANPLALRVKIADIHDNLEPWRLARLPEAKRLHFLRKYGHALVALAE